VTKVRWTPQAADDLQAIYDFIARDSPYYAKLTIEGILSETIIFRIFHSWGAAFQKAPATIFEN
jgi:hypothetical protein